MARTAKSVTPTRKKLCERLKAESHHVAAACRELFLCRTIVIVVFIILFNLACFFGDYGIVRGIWDVVGERTLLWNHAQSAPPPPPLSPQPASPGPAPNSALQPLSSRPVDQNEEQQHPHTTWTHRRTPAHTSNRTRARTLHHTLALSHARTHTFARTHARSGTVPPSHTR
jgi:hypothetical protein